MNNLPKTVKDSPTHKRNFMGAESKVYHNFC